jgi:non-heme chloroperoxidase
MYQTCEATAIINRTATWLTSANSTTIWLILSVRLNPHHLKAKWALVGFSSGGGFALGIAAGPLGQSFQRYLLLAPFLRYDAPTERGNTPIGQASEEKQVWAVPAVQRMIALETLNSAGIHAFDWLPVIYFAVPPDASVTSSYSWRTLLNFQPDEDYVADIRAVSKPMQVLVGEKDELFRPDKFESVFDAERKDIPVTILPGLGHVDMVTNPLAIQAVVTALRQ